MNFTFTWILDKFGFVPKIETVPEKPKRKQTVKKATTKTPSKRRLG